MLTPPRQPDDLSGRSLAHYEITEKIGQGGMGQVYRARDTKLARTVAVKVLPSAFADDPLRLERLKREARLLAALNHPNIATIHGLEDWGGLRFLVMEMVEGQTLEERLSHGPMPPEETLGLFEQLAEALEVAHEEGIIHRDLKPANIKVTPRDRVKVLDFGLAKALEPLTSDTRNTETATEVLTQEGALLGTVGYMSPEQARGKDVDRRTDIWAFGCTLYEALAGAVAFRGESLVDTLAAIIEGQPRWEELPRETSPSIRRLLQRCLEKDPERRYQDMRAVRAEIEQARTTMSDRREMPHPVHRRRRALLLLAATIAVVAGIAAWVAWLGPSLSPEPAAPASAAVSVGPTVAVAPLRNLTGDPTLDWLGEGLANLVRDHLAESRHAAVVSRPRWDALSRIIDEGGDITELAAASGIDYVVFSDLIASPEGLILAARVTDTERGRDLASERIVGTTPESMLESTRRLAILAKQAMTIPHTESVQVLSADFAVNHPGAYEVYLAGLGFFFDFAYQDAAKAFRTVLEMEPDFHMATYRLAHVLAVTGRTTEAVATIERIPADAPLGPRESAYVEGARALLRGDHEAAQTVYRGLLDAYPYDVEGRMFLVMALDGDFDDEGAVRQLTMLAEQEPQNPTVWVSLAETLLRVGQLSEAETAMERYRSLEPRDPFGFTVLGDLHKARGEPAAAIENYRHALELNSSFRRAGIALARALALEGNTREAETVWSEIMEDPDTSPVFRIDAAFDLSAIRRATGRFEASLLPLGKLEPLIREEGIRESMALEVRGRSLVELRRFVQARELMDLAVERSASAVPTRYLFARGLLELAQGELDAVAATATEIRTHALPADDPDRTEEKAAAYLEGMAFLSAGDTARAVDSLRIAVDLGGYRYALYRLGLAAALGAAGRTAEAVKLAAQAASDPGDSDDPRLDLELDRLRGLLLEASLRYEMGETDEARRLARAFLDRWAGAPDHADLARARQVAGS